MTIYVGSKKLPTSVIQSLMHSDIDVSLATGWVGLLLGCVLNKPMLDVLKLGHHGTFLTLAFFRGHSGRWPSGQLASLF